MYDEEWPTPHFQSSNPVEAYLLQAGKEVIIRNKKVSDELIEGVIKRLKILSKDYNKDTYEIIAKSIIDLIREKDRLN